MIMIYGLYILYLQYMVYIYYIGYYYRWYIIDDINYILLRLIYWLI